jgi:hypothetical protein
MTRWRDMDDRKKETLRASGEERKKERKERYLT